MYKIDKDGNRILPLREEKFGDLGFTERNHLQEWIVKEPNVFGEELLIIQKEFDGFDETNERLDLLALDENGNLVVIENKLDDSGRDVVWQALKYASYCSTLKKSKIINIFQKYLDKNQDEGNAEDAICEFLGKSDLDDVLLNGDNRQRVIFVAASFRKEVTSTVLWLLGYGVRIQCFKANPYSMDGGEGNYFLKVEQIIPTPEASEFMIGMSDKKAEERGDALKSENKQSVNKEFWIQALDGMKQNDEFDLYNGVSPSINTELNAGSGLDACPFRLVFTKKAARVALVISRADKDENKRVFDKLKSQREEIEKDFGDTLDWERSDEKKQSSIEYRKVFDGQNREEWPKIIDWMIVSMSKFESVIRPLIQEIKPTTKRENARGVGSAGAT